MGCDQGASGSGSARTQAQGPLGGSVYTPAWGSIGGRCPQPGD